MLIDKIQHRYSWTDEIIRDLPYARFFEIIEAIEFAEEQERQREMFHTWQLLSAQGLKVGFKEYYEGIYPKSKEETTFSVNLVSIAPIIDSLKENVLFLLSFSYKL